MKLASFIKNGSESAALVIGQELFDIQSLQPDLPETLQKILEDWERFFPLLAGLSTTLSGSSEYKSRGILLSEAKLLAPLPKPNSLRDGYAFRQHVASARRNRGLDMTAVFDSFPVFYFGNHLTVRGPGPVYVMPDHCRKLDFELEAAIVISKRGKNIPASMADEYIAGLMILNDFSARTLQMEEMLLNLGPAKGKDFVTSTGPWLVTPDELRPFEVPCHPNHVGKSWNLQMSASVNGLVLSQGNLKDMDWTFAELIERASYGVELFPGDVIGSGTVGSGCLLELNGTGKLNDPQYKEQWLLPGDEIELMIDGLGVLSNLIIAEPGVYSILELKK
jgi:fumarylacetoacetate (FAA) hydrolase